jgi:glutamate/tyrosine decarboxylase-like PLP-dependent enzyme
MNWNVNEKLSLSREQMKELGYRAVDMVVEHVETLAERPVSRTATRAELEARLREPFPEGPSDPARLFDRLARDVLANLIHVDHPRYFGFVPGPSNYVGAIADLLASGFNVFAGTWLEGSGPAEVELVCIDWLKSLCGYPESAAGLFVSGGSAANLTALMVARQEKLGDDSSRGVAYFSDQTHSSIERAFRVLGIPSARLKSIPTDAEFRLSPGELERALRRDRERGLVPFAVVASAGTTNTGAVDPLREIAAIARRENLWLHVDGALGAAALLSSRAHLLDGVGESDSLSLDPHKWLFQPYAAGTVLLREGNLLKKHYHILPAYLADVAAKEEEINYCDYGIELTRGFRALKLWMTIQLFGLDNLRKAVERGLVLAERAEALLREKPGFEIVAGATLGVVAFRYLPPPPEEANDFNRRLVMAVIEDGFSLVSSTELAGKTAIRICPINPRTTEGDLEATVDRIEEIAKRSIRR